MVNEYMCILSAIVLTDACVCHKQVRDDEDEIMGGGCFNIK